MKILKTMLGLLVACMLLGASCQTRPPPIPIEPHDTVDCAAACERLQHLGCPEGDPLSDGTTCLEFCTNTQQSGHPLNPSCVMDMESCNDLPGCTNPRR
jgi:hypothetical protein